MSAYNPRCEDGADDPRDMGGPFTCWCGETGLPSEMFGDDLGDGCGGGGYLPCYCGGDLCVCHYHGGTECDGCEDCGRDDEGDWPDEDDPTDGEDS